MDREVSERGIEALLKDASRSGRKPKITEEDEVAPIEAALHSKPERDTHWSVSIEQYN